MARHVAVVKMFTDDFERINRLLQIDDMEFMTDEELDFIGATKNYNERVYVALFDDWSNIIFNLCSGTNNYYDDVVWFNKEWNRSVCFDCEFELLESNEYVIDGETYVVQIEKL